MSRPFSLLQIAEAPAPIRGAAWMVAAAAAFATMTALVRKAGGVMHPFEIAFFRNLFGLLAMAPWFMRTGLAGLRTRRLGAYGIRAAFGLTAMLLWFWAVTAMPLGEAVALSFTAPLFASVAAVIVLRETMGPRRSAALLAGFAGALIMLRPGFIAITAPALMVLSSSLFIAGSVTVVKMLSRTESASAIVTWMGLFLTPLSLIPALFVWTWPGWRLLALLALIGTLATIGQVAMTRAYAVADATVVLPFDYGRLPFAAAVGYVAFGEAPDAWTWAGAAVIAVATVYMTHREARLAPPEAGVRIGTATLEAGGAAVVPTARGRDRP